MAFRPGKKRPSSESVRRVLRRRFHRWPLSYWPKSSPWPFGYWNNGQRAVQKLKG